MTRDMTGRDFPRWAARRAWRGARRPLYPWLVYTTHSPRALKQLGSPDGALPLQARQPASSGLHAAPRHLRAAGDRGAADRGGEDRAGHRLAQAAALRLPAGPRSEEHTSELQSLMRISYAVFCLKKKKNTKQLT